MNLVITNETQEQRQKRGSNSKERPSRKGGTQAATNPGSKNPPQKLPIRPNAKSKTKESSNQSNGFIPNKSNNARYDSGKSSRSKVSRVARLAEHEYKIWPLSRRMERGPRIPVFLAVPGLTPEFRRRSTKRTSKWRTTLLPRTRSNGRLKGEK